MVPIISLSTASLSYRALAHLAIALIPSGLATYLERAWSKRGPGTMGPTVWCVRRVA